jgi:hypothetical protein
MGRYGIPLSRFSLVDRSPCPMRGSGPSAIESRHFGLGLGDLFHLVSFLVGEVYFLLPTSLLPLYLRCYIVLSRLMFDAFYVGFKLKVPTQF